MTQVSPFSYHSPMTNHIKVPDTTSYKILMNVLTDRLVNYQKEMNGDRRYRIGQLIVELQRRHDRVSFGSGLIDDWRPLF